MPLTAKIKTTGEIVNILRYEKPRMQLPAKDLVCPGCGEKMIIVTSNHMINHFRHRRRDICNNHPGKGKYSTGESLEHLIGKIEMGRLVANQLFKDGYNEDDITIDHEVYVKAINRWADVVVTCGETKIVVEVQISTQTYEEASQRIQDYESQGFEVRYALGERVTKNPCLDAVIDHECQAYFISFEKTRQRHNHVPLSGYSHKGG